MGSGDRDEALVRVTEGLTGAVVIHAECRCRYDLVSCLVAHVDGLWPGEIRLVLQNGSLWTDPQLPAEFIEQRTIHTVQLIRVDATRSIPSSPLSLGIVARLAQITHNVHINHNHDDWCRDLGEPTASVFERLRNYVDGIGYTAIARMLLLRRRMEELLPLHNYNADAVLTEVLHDDAYWAYLEHHVGKNNGKALVRSLWKSGIINFRC